MATSYETVRKYLDEMSIKYHFDEEEQKLILLYKTNSYKDEKGRDGVYLVIRLSEDGEYFMLFAPTLYSYKEGPHKLAVFQTCMMVSWKTKMLQFEYDASDGEIRAIIEFPLEDALLTKKQLKRMISALVQFVDEFDPAFRAAMQSGKVEVPEKGSFAQMAELIAAVQGSSPETVKEIVEEIAKRRAGKGKGPDEL